MWNYIKDNKYPSIKDDGESEWVLCAIYKFSDETYEPDYIACWWNGKVFENYSINNLDINTDYYKVVKWMYIPK